MKIRPAFVSYYAPDDEKHVGSLTREQAEHTPGATMISSFKTEDGGRLVYIGPLSGNPFPKVK